MGRGAPWTFCPRLFILVRRYRSGAWKPPVQEDPCLDRNLTPPKLPSISFPDFPAPVPPLCFKTQSFLSVHQALLYQAPGCSPGVTQTPGGMRRGAQAAPHRSPDATAGARPSAQPHHLVTREKQGRIVKPHQTSATNVFQIRFNINNCLIANKGRSPPLLLLQDSHSAAPNETLSKSDSFCSPFLRHKVILEATSLSPPRAPRRLQAAWCLCRRAARGWRVSVRSNGQK